MSTTQSLRQTMYSVTYDYAGSPTAADIICGRAQPRGGAFAESCGMSHQYLRMAELVPALQAWGHRPRAYSNALVEQAIELTHDIPLPLEFFDETTFGAVYTSGEITSRPPAYGNDGLEMACAAVATRGDQLGNYLVTLTSLQLMRAYELEIAAIAPTLTMIANGVRLNVAALHAAIDGYESRLSSMEESISRDVQRQVNLQDDTAVIRLVYGDLGMQLPEGNRGLLTLDFLRQLNHPRMPDVVVGRELVGWLNVLRPLAQSVTLDSPFAHPDLNPRGECTWRYRCSNPPFQCFPNDLRSLVVASPGCTLIEVDLRHADLRVAAHYSQDPHLLAGLTSRAQEPHSHTAARVYSLPCDAITAQQRQVAKELTCAALYNQGPAGVARTLECDTATARDLQQRFWRNYPSLQEFLEGTREGGFQVRTLFGRSLDRSADPIVGLIQGSQAEILKFKLAELVRELGGEARLLLTVHDSVLIEVEEGKVNEITARAVAVMEHTVPRFTCPLFATASTGPTWGTMTPWRA